MLLITFADNKLSLVWMDYKLSELTPIRSSNIGAERAPDRSADLELARRLTSALGSLYSGRGVYNA